MSEESGFFSRWSRRKVEARQGVDTTDTAAPEARSTEKAQPRTLSSAPAADISHGQVLDAPESGTAPASDPASPASPPPPPTLEDVTSLTHESDFTRFVSPEVSGEVRNAALKKLFSDPHFNVMDGLDTYIEDYNQTTPLPLETIRQMAQSAFLGLVDQDEEKEEATHPLDQRDQHGQTALRDPPEEEATGDVSAAHSPAAALEAATTKSYDENPSLRLQSLDPPGPPDPDPDAGEGGSPP